MTCVLIDLFSPEKYINKLTDCCGNFIVYLENNRKLYYAININDEMPVICSDTKKGDGL
jgi:hypothetical protein